MSTTLRANSGSFVSRVHALIPDLLRAAIFYKLENRVKEGFLSRSVRIDSLADQLAQAGQQALLRSQTLAEQLRNADFLTLQALAEPVRLAITPLLRDLPRGAAGLQGVAEYYAAEIALYSLMFIALNADMRRYLLGQPRTPTNV